MDTSTRNRNLFLEASIAFNEMRSIETERKAVFNQLQSVDRYSEAYETLRQAYDETRVKWRAAYDKFQDTAAIAVKRDEEFLNYFRMPVKSRTQ